MTSEHSQTKQDAERVVQKIEGVEKVVNIALTSDEKAMLEKSAAAVKELIEASKRL